MTDSYKPADLRGRRVLVTGAHGFVGGHLVPLLVTTGAEVATVSRAETRYPGLRHFSVDLRDQAACERAITEARPEIIYHLAATRERATAVSVLRSVFDTNFFATVNLLDAATKTGGLQTIVVLGSSEEYGDSMPPFVEAMREAPVSVYSLSKVCSTYLAQFMHRVHKVPCVIVRPSVAYGPGQDPDMFLPEMIRTIAANRAFRMTRGQQTRDFVYVSDLVDALVRASMMIDGQVLNVASGIPTAIAEVAMKVGRLMGREHLVQIGALEHRPSEVMSHFLDNTLASGLLHWTPRVGLDDGLARTVRAHLEVPIS